jgi:hypothetical protein
VLRDLRPRHPGPTLGPSCAPGSPPDPNNAFGTATIIRIADYHQKNIIGASNQQGACESLDWLTARAHPGDLRALPSWSDKLIQRSVVRK